MQLTLKQAQGNFFDRKAVVDAVGRAKANVFARQGGLVRKIMAQSMKVRKKPAAPGKPPNAHLRLIKDFIFFALDPATKTLVVGPVKLGKGNAPATLEFSGTVTDTGIQAKSGKFTPLRMMSAKGRAAALKSGRLVKRTFKVAARPFAAPALDAAKSKLPQLWKDQVKG